MRGVAEWWRVDTHVLWMSVSSMFVCFMLIFMAIYDLPTGAGGDQNDAVSVGTYVTVFAPLTAAAGGAVWRVVSKFFFHQLDRGLPMPLRSAAIMFLGPVVFYLAVLVIRLGVDGERFEGAQAPVLFATVCSVFGAAYLPLVYKLVSRICDRLDVDAGT